MILDGHVHIDDGPPRPNELLARMQEAGVAGGVVISLPPPAYRPSVRPEPAGRRLDGLMAWCPAGGELYPFYWLDPLEHDATDQVAQAVERGVAGFKVICDRYGPGNDRAIEVFQAVARTRRPILFHSGILWDGKPSSSFNRPAEFEALLRAPGLRFALAHISWPWCDELIATYGKFLNARRRTPGYTGEMFIDTTPGTPPIYRREALTRLFTVGYDVAENVMFGTDCLTSRYDVDWTRQWLDRDRQILCGLDLPERTVAGVFGENLKRFLAVGPP